MPRIPPHLTRYARDLRTNATEAERLIWHRLRHHRPRFTGQLVVGKYILDLACRSTRIAIEFDGSQHLDSTYDAERTAFLERLGWRVLRFWNAKVAANPDGVAEAIVAAAGQPRPLSHPRPLASGEGRR